MVEAPLRVDSTAEEEKEVLMIITLETRGRGQEVTDTEGK